MATLDKHADDLNWDTIGGKPGHKERLGQPAEKNHPPTHDPSPADTAHNGLSLSAGDASLGHVSEPKQRYDGWSKEYSPEL